VVVVLGQALDRGTVPRSLAGRLDTAAHLIHEETTARPTSVLVVLSGADTTGAGITEARAMRQYLDRALAPAAAAAVTVVEEPAARNTVENALFCTDMLQAINVTCGGGGVNVVTNEFHVPRARAIFECVFHAKRFAPGHWTCVAAPSGLVNNGPYRPLPERPADVTAWRLCERLDWECHAIQTLNDYLAKYDLPPLPPARIDSALAELREMNRTSPSPPLPSPPPES
jgi:hypothetical protein